MASDSVTDPFVECKEEASSLGLTGVDFTTYIQERAREERQRMGELQKHKLVVLQTEETKRHGNEWKKEIEIEKIWSSFSQQQTSLDYFSSET